MTPEGVTLQHPDCVWIGGAWRKPHSGRSIEIASPKAAHVEQAPQGPCRDTATGEPLRSVSRPSTGSG